MVTIYRSFMDRLSKQEHLSQGHKHARLLSHLLPLLLRLQLLNGAPGRLDIVRGLQLHGYDQRCLLLASLHLSNVGKMVLYGSYNGASKIGKEPWARPSLLETIHPVEAPSRLVGLGDLVS